MFGPPLPRKAIALATALLALSGLAPAASAEASASAAAKPPTQEAAIAKLRADSGAAHTSALYIVRDGRVLVNDHAADAPEFISIQSITKSVVSLAIGKLIADGKIASLDDAVQKYLPEYRGERQAKVTLRHVLTHRTGIAVGADFGLGVEGSKDALAYAMAAEFDAEPGEKYQYNNTAVQLSRGVIERVTGQPMDVYISEAIFKPLGIRQFLWGKDPSGKVWAHADLKLRAVDLAKIGLLVAGRGEYAGRRIIAASWFDTATPKVLEGDFTQISGVWWMDISDPEKSRDWIASASIPPMVAAGLPERVAARLRAFAALGEVGEDAFYDKYLAEFTPEEQKQIRDARLKARVPVIAAHIETVGYYSTGGGGQYLVMIPAKKFVAVRLIRPEAVKDKATEFDDFLPQSIELGKMDAPTNGAR